MGWTEGRNVQIEYRWSNGDIDRVRAYAAELVGLTPDVILANGSPVIAAFKQTTHSIPIVFVIVNDPVAQGYVSNLAHPDGNITGFSFIDYSVLGRSLQMLKQMAPAVTRIGFMFNPDAYPYYDVYLASLQAASQTLALKLTGVRVRSDAEIEQEIAKLASDSGGGLLIPPEPFLFAHREPIIRLTAQRRSGAAHAVIEGITAAPAGDRQGGD